MTKTAKSNAQWAADMLIFAKSGKDKMGKGRAPKINTSWHKEYVGIYKCPQHTRSRTISSAFAAATSGNGNATSSNCNCKWHNGEHRFISLVPKPAPPIPPVAVAAAAAEAPPAPPIKIPFYIPKKPKPRSKVGDVVNVHKTYYGEVLNVGGEIYKLEFDLTVFGFTCGKCPHCGGIPTTTNNLNSSIKIIHTFDVPRFVQGVGMNCSAWHEQLKDDYTHRYESTVALGVDVVEFEEFPRVDISHAAKQEGLMRALVRDYFSVRPELNREMASLTSERSLAIDHQAKVVKRVKGNKALQACTIVSDVGLVLGHYTVPTDDMEWIDLAMDEILERHGAKIDPNNPHKLIERGRLPQVIYVDKDCCNGKEGSRNEDNRLFYGMIKILDGFHLICRIGREINSEHDRKPKFMNQLSRCIYTSSSEDSKKLQAARAGAGLTELTAKEKKSDRQNYVRRVISDPPKIVAKMLAVLKTNIALDRQARLVFERDGKSCENLSPAHDAYPLVTKKVTKCVMRQCTHILNGCVADAHAVNIQSGTANYRKSGITLPTFKSTRGSSKVEAAHSVNDGAMYTQKNVREIVYDLRLHWKLTNYNRKILRKLGKPALVDSIAPSETDCSYLVEKTNLRFGYDYYNYKTRDVQRKIQDAVIVDLDNDSFVMEVGEIDDDMHFEDDEDTDNDDDSDDDSVVGKSSNADPALVTTIPNEVNFSDLGQIGLNLDKDLVETNGWLGDIFDGIDLGAEAGASCTMIDCMHNADGLVANAGIDLSVTADADNVMEVHQSNVNRRRNVAARRSQNQQTPQVGPSFNDQMSNKWLEIWTDPSISQPRRGTQTSWHGWYNKASHAYELWRMKQLRIAQKEGTTPPPLFEVGWDAAFKWARNMRQLSNSAHAQGVVNEATAGICEKLDSFIDGEGGDDTFMFDNADGLGAAADMETLTTHTPTATNGPQQFESPTTPAADAAMGRVPKSRAAEADTLDPRMRALLEEEKPPAKKRKTKVPDPEKQRRIQVAAQNMQRLNLTRDTKTKDHSGQLCDVCGKFWTYARGDGIKHKKLVYPDGRQFRFCPLADEQDIYIEHGEEQRRIQKENRAGRNRKWRASKKRSKG